jgi:hypothetical protein
MVGAKPIKIGENTDEKNLTILAVLKGHIGNRDAMLWIF